jgi:spore coat protein CotH
MRTALLFAFVTVSAFAQSAADFFSDSALHEIRIEINAKDLKALIDNYTDNTYYPANVTWRNITVQDVGIRSKGRTSRRAAKPGLRVDIDRFEEQRFLGLKSFLLDNNIQDYSGAKEPLCMQMFQKMGLTAPRETHAKVFVNGEYFGLYTVAESTDKTALKQWFNDDEGYLYEWDPMPNYHFGYLGTDPRAYSRFRSSLRPTRRIPSRARWKPC